LVILCVAKVERLSILRVEKNSEREVTLFEKVPLLHLLIKTAPIQNKRQLKTGVRPFRFEERYARLWHLDIKLEFEL
jgi:hypothetical protein